MNYKTSPHTEEQDRVGRPRLDRQEHHSHKDLRASCFVGQENVSVDQRPEGEVAVVSRDGVH